MNIQSLMDDFINLAETKANDDNIWREQPVNLLTFFTSKKFLNEKPYPGKQTEILEVVGKILWYKITGEEAICEDDLKKITECVFLLGKGSGKDFLASGILAYVSYLLCCMKDPHGYFGFAQEEPIDLINVAINAYQANNVFFKKFKARLLSCSWFIKKEDYPKHYNEFQLTKNQIRFYKGIAAHSAHSEADSFEGFNPLVVIFDEIGGFELDNAENSYTTLRSSAVSRFNEKMLLIFISFPRSQEDFMMKKYNEALIQKDDQVYAIIGKSWEVNPKIRRDALRKDYERDPEGAAMKFESLTGDTLIYTADGAYPITDLAEGSIIRTAFGPREVGMFIDSGIKSVYELSTLEGYTIKGSINHPMKIYSDSKPVWKTIGELQSGDKIYLDLHNNLFGESTLSEDMVILFGEIVKKLKELPTLINTYTLTPDTKPLESETEKLSALRKELIEIVFKQPREMILKFLKVVLKPNRKSEYLLKTTDKGLLKQLQQLLLMAGIISEILKIKQPKNRTRKVKFLLRSKSQNKQQPFCTVKNIKYLGEEECFDLWVEPENEFTANGMVVHNCIPPAYIEGLFQFPEKVDECIHVGKTSQCYGLTIAQKISTRTLQSGEQRHFLGLEIFNLHLNPTFVYYIGGDGGVNTDSYVVSLFHAEPVLISVVENGETISKYVNKPIEDLILEWKPSKRDRLPVDLLNVADILELICRQVHVKKALFDKFNSAEVVQRLISCGVDAEDKNWSNQFQIQLYQNMKSLIYTNNIELLDHTVDDTKKLNANQELKSIRLINGIKIDHDKDKSKDFSDARVAAAWLCSTDEPETASHFSMPTIAGAIRRN